MAATIGDTSIQRLTGATNAISFSHAHDGNTLVVAYIAAEGAAKPTISSLQFDGNAPTSVIYDNVTGQAAESCYHLAVWENVSAVTANVTGTLSRFAYGAVWAVSVSDAPTSSVTAGNDVNVVAEGATTSQCSIAEVPAGAIVLDFIGAVGNVSASLAEDASQTEWDTPTFAGAWYTTSASSESGSGTVDMDWTWTGANGVVHMAVAISAGSSGSIVPQAMAQYINQVIQ